MSAPAKRSLLKRAVWEAMAKSNRCGPDCPDCVTNVAWAMASAETYADALAEQQIEQMTPDELRARLRLAEATAEADGRAT